MKGTCQLHPPQTPNAIHYSCRIRRPTTVRLRALLRHDPRNHAATTVIVPGSNGPGDREYFRIVTAAGLGDNPRSCEDEQCTLWLCRGLRWNLQENWPQMRKRNEGGVSFERLHRVLVMAMEHAIGDIRPEFAKDIRQSVSPERIRVLFGKGARRL